MTSRPSILAAAVLAAAVVIVPAGRAARAQTPPDPGELAAYDGLHAAAARGDVDAIRRLAVGGGGLDRRDGNGRTPLHVAFIRLGREICKAPTPRCRQCPLKELCPTAPRYL